MPLPTFSKFLSLKPSISKPLEPEKPQFLAPPSGTTSQLPTSPRSFTIPWNGSTRKKDVNPGSNTARESRRFDPFNIISSFRSRSRVLDSASSYDSVAKRVSNLSHSSHSGYEDEEYGEPEAESEEIRRPSGLGRRASIVEIMTGGVDGMDATDAVGDGTQLAAMPVAPDFIGAGVRADTTIKDADSRRSSESNDDDEPADIRYPSGLGNFKIEVNTFNVERPLSTYPIFGLDHTGAETRPRYDTLASVALSSTNRLSRLSAIIPLVASYLPRKSLVALTLVDHAVAKESRRLLWKDVTVRLKVSPRGSNEIHTDGDASAALLETLSTRHELASLVESLDLSCQLDDTATSSKPQVSSWSAPASPSPKLATSSGQRLLTPLEPIQPRTAPAPSKPHLEASYVPSTPPESVDKHRMASKLRRASLLLRPSFMSKADDPDVSTWQLPAVKRPPSMQLPRRMSMLRIRSSEMLGRITVESFPGSQGPPSTNDEPGAPVPSLKPLSLPGESMWTPPDDWTAPESPRSSVMPRVVPSLPSVGSFMTLSPSPSPPSTAGWKAPTDWEAAPSGLSPIVLLHRSQPSLQSLRHQPPSPPSSASSDKTHMLRVSPSLPSMRVLRSSTTARPHSASHQAQEPPSPATTTPSPNTPYSTISLSAFPFPPSFSAPPSVPPLPAQFSRPYIQPTGGITPTSAISQAPAPTQYRGLDVRLLKTLATALSNMPNVANATLVFISPPKSLDSSAYGTTSLKESHLYRWAKEANVEHLNPEVVMDVNKTFSDIFMKMKSLKSLKIVCPVEYAEVSRQQWLELRGLLKDLEIEIASA